MISGVGGFAASAGFCKRNDAPEETFTRFQLAAVIDSPIHRIWRLGWLTGWLAGWVGAGWVGRLTGVQAGALPESCIRGLRGPND